MPNRIDTANNSRQNWNADDNKDETAIGSGGGQLSNANATNQFQNYNLIATRYRSRKFVKPRVLHKQELKIDSRGPLDPLGET